MIDVHRKVSTDIIITYIIDITHSSKYISDDIICSICRFQNFPTNRNKSTSYLHIKKSKLSKENYKPINILPNISNISESCLYDQIATHFEHIFSRYEFIFCNGYSAQHCLLAVIEKMGKNVNDGGLFGALLTGLSKA